MAVYIEQKESNCRTFQLGEEPELIHIIKTGFRDMFFVVYEDAYQICNDMKVENYTKEQIKQKFGIEL